MILFKDVLFVNEFKSLSSLRMFYVCSVFVKKSPNQRFLLVRRFEESLRHLSTSCYLRSNDTTGKSSQHADTWIK